MARKALTTTANDDLDPIRMDMWITKFFRRALEKEAERRQMPLGNCFVQLAAERLKLPIAKCSLVKKSPGRPAKKV